MRELSLNILDIVENSVRAGATLIKVSVMAKDGFLTIEIADDGKGMSEEFLRSVTDPFTTTRTTRKVGMGIPLFKMAAETANGSFDIKSKTGEGTTVTAKFEIDNVDRAPLGNLAETAATELFDGTPDFVWTLTVENRSYSFDTRDLKKQLDGISVDNPEITVFVKELLTENFETVRGGIDL
mgnify:CR=1 FL=1